MLNKVLLYQDVKTAGFKSERIRKNIKAAYEDNGIEYTDNLADSDYLIAHLLLPFDESIIKSLYNDGKKIVVSIFYSETESKCNLTNIRITEDNENFNVANSFINALQKVNKVLVPYKEYADFLTSKGVEATKIEIVTPGINNRIYKYLSETDMSLAKRYFSIDDNTKIIVAFGSYLDKKCIANIEELSIKRPDVKIIFIGSDKLKESLFFKIRKAFRKQTYENIIYSSFVDINIYRSLLKNARAVLLLNSYFTDEVQVLEAFAAEAQVIALDSAVPGILRNNLIIHSDDINDLFKLISDFLDYKISNTISKAHFYVDEQDVNKLGEKLKEIYLDLLKEEWSC